MPPRTPPCEHLFAHGRDPGVGISRGTHAHECATVRCARRFAMLRDRFGTSWMLLLEGRAA